MNTRPFGWHDLACDDVARAAEFYSAAFDWRCRAAQANGGVYHRLSAGGRDVASLYRIGAPARERGQRPHWTSYICVESVDAALARAVAAGGTVLVRPFDVVDPGAGRIARIALVADPQGAAFGLWEGATAAA
jgi:predicted enzyme related to lactoylglutathione lyase